MMISVIIPIYNSAKTIVNALNSVKAQTVGVDCFEIIIVNDGSTDDTEIFIKNYMMQNPEMNIQNIAQENGGVSKARNTALRIAKGDYIAFLDADDEWFPEKIEKQLTWFENKDLKIDFLATRRNGNGILFPYIVKNDLAEITFSKLLIRNESQPSTVVFRRSILRNTGYFNDDQRYAEDVNYWMKISKNNKMYILDENLVICGGGKRSFGESGLSADLKEMKNGYRRNLHEMYVLKYLSLPQYTFYKLFYKAKYLLLVFRTFY